MKSDNLYPVSIENKQWAAKILRSTAYPVPKIPESITARLSRAEERIVRLEGNVYQLRRLLSIIDENAK
jgi:hypothetical protein